MDGLVFKVAGYNINIVIMVFLYDFVKHVIDRKIEINDVYDDAVEDDVSYVRLVSYLVYGVMVVISDIEDFPNFI